MKNLFFFGWAAMVAVVVSSCRTPDLPDFVLEESNLSLMQITNESRNTVYGHAFERGIPVFFNASCLGSNEENGVTWSTSKLLDVSPDGQYVSFVSNIDNKLTIATHRSTSGGGTSLRKSGGIVDLAWGYDGKIYFGECDENYYSSHIRSVNDKAGTAIQNHTSGSYFDCQPAVTRDGNKVFFTRITRNGCSVWSRNKNGEEMQLTQGYDPGIVANSKNSFVCVRNNSHNGNSEIYLINGLTNSEECILSNPKQSYTNPCVSPDGKWVVFQANTKSPNYRKKNLDIYVARIDGSDITQLTHHPALDCCPVFSPDGKYIYFISSRGNNDGYFNVWRMNFTGM